MSCFQYKHEQLMHAMQTDVSIRAYATVRVSCILIRKLSRVQNNPGVLTGQQHGLTRVITSCDADDPECSFRTSPEGYAEGHWRSSAPMADPALTVQVEQDMKAPSSFEVNSNQKCQLDTKCARSTCLAQRFTCRTLIRGFECK